ncbi:MAG: DUF6069 family protein [Chloroflexia bacterium]
MASIQIATQSKSNNRVDVKSVVRASAIAATAAIVGNIVILGIATLLLGVPFMGQTVNPISIIVSTLISTALAGIVYALLLRSARQPERTFTIVGVVGYIVSLSGPLMGMLGMMPGVVFTSQLVVAMLFMHTWSAAVIVRTLISQAHRAS